MPHQLGTMTSRNASTCSCCSLLGSSLKLQPRRIATTDTNAAHTTARQRTQTLSSSVCSVKHTAPRLCLCRGVRRGAPFCNNSAARPGLVACTNTRCHRHRKLDSAAGVHAWHECRTESVELNLVSVRLREVAGCAATRSAAGPRVGGAAVALSAPIASAASGASAAPLVANSFQR